jgi:hypothetical protein
MDLITQKSLPRTLPTSYLQKIASEPICCGTFQTLPYTASLPGDQPVLDGYIDWPN